MNYKDIKILLENRLNNLNKQFGLNLRIVVSDTKQIRHFFVSQGKEVGSTIVAQGETWKHLDGCLDSFIVGLGANELIYSHNNLYRANMSKSERWGNAYGYELKEKGDMK